MKIKIIWVGKTKEEFIREGIKKYCRFLNPYADVSVLEIKEEKGKDIRRIKEREGERILSLQIPFVLLDEEGKGLSSVEFAGFIQKQGPRVNFVLGGAYGSSRALKEKAQTSISLSNMTFTHEMSRVILLEQLYRAFTIIHKRSYHH